MLRDARRRALRQGVPFSLTIEDIVIPVTCPILGIRLKVNRGGRGPCDASPSLDRIVPARGYVPGNVRVVSYRGNQLKSDATIAELRLVLADAERCRCPERF